MFSSGLYWLGIAAVIAVAVYLLFVGPARRRRKLSRLPLSGQWQQWLKAAVPHYGALPKDMQRQLEENLKILVAEKAFYGCDGLEIEERHQVTIAAQASLLLMGRSADEFSAVQAILLYPSAFRVPSQAPNALGPWSEEEAGIVSDEDDIHLGESWGEGRIILSWADIEDEIGRRQSGLSAQTSVVIHEFAHQLDQAEGISAAMSGTQDGPGQVLAKAYRNLTGAVDRGDDTLLDPYGATNPQEFVAVATEMFFEQPVSLRQQEPDLYQVLSRIYRIDLAGHVAAQEHH